MQRFSNILLVFEPDAANSEALRRAVTLAERNGAALTVAAMAPDLGPGADQALTEALANGVREELRHLLQMTDTSGIAVGTALMRGVAFVEIIRSVIDRGYDLLIKAAEPADDMPDALGSGDKKLLRKCPCPVWLVRGAGDERYDRILVAVDYRPDSQDNTALNRQLLEMAASLAHADGARLHAVHAWRLGVEAALRSPNLGAMGGDIDALRARTEDARDAWLDGIVGAYCRFGDTPIETDVHLLHGPARQIVPEIAQRIGAQLVVMGTVGRTGIPGYLIGNTAESILSRIDCSIMAVKPPGFMSPVAAG